MNTTVPKKLTQLFLEKRLVTEARLADAVEAQKSQGQFFGSFLVEQGWISLDRLMEVLAEYYQIRYVRLDDTTIDPKAIASMPLKVALHYHTMPIALRDSTLTVAISNPQDVQALDDLQLALQRRYTIEPVLASNEEILRAVKAHYGVGAETVSRILTERPNAATAKGTDEEALEDIEQLASEASVVKLVNQLILEAHSRRATDIHLEPYRGKVRLRYRIDGMLHAVDIPPALRQLYPAIVSRVKVLSNLDIVERRLPQDGRASVKIGDQKLDLRISAMPTPSGQSVVIRILPNQMLLDLHDLGFHADDQKTLEMILKKPHGIIFVTGPTGSGKTTTLYACLKTINAEERKIITLEDPIEYELEGITQVHVNPAIGLTFAQGLRGMLRHDPNVMMVGEVRDAETAELAIRIALTGHLVLSTLHTNDAAGGITRLMDMGIDPYLITSSVECVIGQRLIRLLCSTCKEAATIKRDDGNQWYRSRGCKQCHQTGYHGRIAIYEFFLMAQSLKDLVLKKASADMIRRAAIELGMRPMRDAGMEKVNAGLTTLDEILRVTEEGT